jgi:hypothetical protein
VNETSPGYVERLRAELLAAAGRQAERSQRHRPPRGVLVAVCAALLAVAAVVGIVSLDQDDAAAGVEVTVQDGRITVLLTDLESRPEAIEQATRDAGLDVVVTALPTGPSNVGRFIRGVETEPVAEVLTVDERGSTFAGFSVPVGWDGRLELAVGRPAGEGESYVQATDAFLPGEPLTRCDLRGVTAGDAAGALRRLGFEQVRFLAEPRADVPSPPLALDEIEQSVYAIWLVHEALAQSADTLLVRLSPPDQAASEVGSCRR